MKNWIKYIFLALYSLSLVSCTYDTLESEQFFDKVVVRLTLNVPGSDSRVVGDYQPGSSTQNPYDNDLDKKTELQRYIDDVHILLFENKTNGTLIDFVTATIGGDQGDLTRTIEGKFPSHNGSLNVVVLANVIQNGLIINFDNYIGKTEKEVYEVLAFNYPEKGWKLETQARYLPMWGKINNVTLDEVNNSSEQFNLYRGVAKMGLQVAETCTNFTMKEIYIYHVNSKGYCAAPNQTPVSDVNIQYTFPDIPSSSTLFSEPIKYTLTSEQAKNFINQIYLSESDNKNKKTEAEKLKVVVGGLYTGPGLVANGAISYYRIDMEDDKDGVLAPFDIIRNHSYIFNITKVVNPGTPTPEEALEEAVVGLTVDVEEWTDEYMRGVPDQYTLTTNKSVITYEAYNDKNGQTIDIWTDYSDGWYLEGLDEAESAWLDISATSGEDNATKTITLTPKADNNGVTRIASFYVVAGNIQKEITVRQPQPPTANCYVRGNGEYELIVSIKGNGNDGATLYENNTTIKFDNGDASITPDKIGIIWETKAGLVKLLNPLDKPVTNTEGQLTLVDYNKTTNSIKYVVNTTGATIGGKEGGNALIGAFKNTAAEGAAPVYEVIWSWHIWVSPDLFDSQTKTVKESAVEKWTLNDYDVLDRNLGALKNRPVETQTDNTKSVASMGLLYQWGRKDPFIGAAYSNDDFTGTGLLPVVHYYENWNAARITDNSTAINTTIAHPTRMIYGGTNNNPTGLSSMAENGGFLWGTNNGLSTTVKDLGSKTIYDPCPVGYRVPPVDAFVFKSPRLEPNDAGSWTVVSNTTLTNVYIQWGTSKNGGTTTVQQYEKSVNPLNDRPNNTFGYYRVRTVKNTTTNKSSDVENWNENLKYVPHNVSSRSWQEQSQYIYNYSGDWVGNNVGTRWDPIYEGNANYYGFYLNYKEIDEPITQYGSMYLLKDDDPEKITWLPLTGAYDPTKGVSFKSGNSTIAIEQGSSITVNSFLWTNSSVLNGSQRIPAAMFLHGTETGGGGSGRHIHGMTQSNIKAEPHYAGAVRCVRDRAKTKWDINSLSETATIRNTVGSIMTINIVSVNADWELIDPGKPWLQVTPDKGSADKGAGTEITLKMLEAGHSGETATLVFKIANETETRSCVVTVQ